LSVPRTLHLARILKGERGLLAMNGGGSSPKIDFEFALSGEPFDGK
jgi:hypothetical protein